MKKILVIAIVLLLSACSFNIDDIDNTPTKKVEEYLSNYQSLSSDGVLCRYLHCLFAAETFPVHTHHSHVLQHTAMACMATPLQLYNSTTGTMVSAYSNY